jgi:Flp pilus assembly protein TadD
MGRADLAEKDTQEAVRVEPTFAEGHAMLAMMALEKEDFSGAITAADKAIELKPGLARAYMYRGHAHARMGKADEAMKDMDRAVGLDSSNYEGFMIRGILRMQREEFDGAVEDFTKMVELAPKIPEGYANRALGHLGKGDYAKAVADLEHAISLTREDDPRRAEFRSVLDDAKRAMEKK